LCHAHCAKTGAGVDALIMVSVVIDDAEGVSIRRQYWATRRIELALVVREPPAIRRFASIVAATTAPIGNNQAIGAQRRNP